MASEPEVHRNDGPHPPPPPAEAADDSNKTPRHSRWTRHETLTLIEGKKLAENMGRRGRRSSSVFGSDHLEPKWDTVASYCKQRAVNRGPVQCRKRWGNMVGDFKKIKAWESQVDRRSDSYWVMGIDARKENRMPVSFDRELYDVLDGKDGYELALVAVKEEEDGGGGGDAAEFEADGVFDSGRRAGLDDGLFSEFEKMEDAEEGGEKDDEDDNETIKIHDPVPISGDVKDRHTNSDYRKESMSQEGCKRKRASTNECEDKSLNDRLIDVLEKNVNVLNAHIEAANTNYQLDRDQRKDYNDSLLSVLNKIADALNKIADKF